MNTARRRSKKNCSKYVNERNREDRIMQKLWQDIIGIKLLKRLNLSPVLIFFYFFHLRTTRLIKQFKNFRLNGSSIRAQSTNKLNFSLTL